MFDSSSTEKNSKGESDPSATKHKLTNIENKLHPIEIYEWKVVFLEKRLCLKRFHNKVD